MHKPSVILHPMLPPGTHDLIAGMDGIAVQRPADNDGVAEVKPGFNPDLKPTI